MRSRVRRWAVAIGVALSDPALAQTGPYGGAGAVLDPEIIADAVFDCAKSARLTMVARMRRGVGTTIVLGGGGGYDTWKIPGPSTVILDGERTSSMEIVDSTNGQFDVLILLENYLTATDTGEAEIRGDPFDLVVLDPAADWTLGDEPFGGGYIAETADGKHRAFIAEGIEIITRGAEALSPTAWWDYPEIDTEVSLAPPPSDTVLEEDGEKRRVIAWPGAGMAIPAFDGPGERGDVGSLLWLDFENGATNEIRLDLLEIHRLGLRMLRVKADPEDRVRFAQPFCWDLFPIADVPPVVRFKTIPRFPVRLTLTGPATLFDGTAIPADRGATAVADSGSFFHLSPDVREKVSAIDLRDGNATVLMLRNDGRLDTSSYIPVVGDPGLDEVWLDGSSGWTVESRDGALRATVPIGAEERVMLVFAPGLRVVALPPPAFTADPSLASLDFYPGTRNVVPAAPTVVVTRGGFVRFSAIQLTGRPKVDMTNGIANTFVLDSAMLAATGGPADLIGDAGLDRVRLEGLRILSRRDSPGGLMLEVEDAAAPGQQWQISLTGLVLED